MSRRSSALERIALIMHEERIGFDADFIDDLQEQWNALRLEEHDRASRAFAAARKALAGRPA